MTKTMSIRMDRENYEFLTELSKRERGDLSKAVRELVHRGRLMLAVEKYRNGEASLGKAAELAGISVGEMIGILAEYGVKANLDQEDYRQGLENLRKPRGNAAALGETLRNQRRAAEVSQGNESRRLP